MARRPVTFPPGAGAQQFLGLQAVNDSLNFDIYVTPCRGTSGARPPPGCVRATQNLSVDAHPAPSPDGSQIAFQTDRDGNWEIYVTDSDGAQHLSRITNDPSDDIRPAWSPDGSQIAFASDREGAGQAIYLVRADGSGPRTRLTELRSSTDPAWSPDGTQIAFSAIDDTGVRQIYAMNADGTGRRELTDDVTSSRSPAWSPDGAMIAFSRDGTIWTMNSDGTDQRLFAGRPAIFLGSPAWPPDGTRIVFDLTARDDEPREGIYSQSLSGAGGITLFLAALPRTAQPATLERAAGG